MKRKTGILIALALFTTAVLALDENQIERLVEAAYPGANVGEIDKEYYQDVEVYEVDFEHDGANFEAIISLDGNILEVEIDD